MQQSIGLSALLAFCWLWPHTSGPVAATEPYLVSAAAAALLLVLWPVGDVARATRLTAWAWLIAALASSVIALLQYFNLEGSLYPLVNIAEPGQAFGNLRQPNQLATLLVIGLMSLRWLVQQARVPHVAVAAMGSLILAALAATASRVGMVELLLCGALAVWWALGTKQSGHARLALWGVGGAVVLYVVAAAALPWLIQSTEGVAGRDLGERLLKAESTCGSRLILWRNVLQLIAQKPWTGWGWGELDYAHYATLYEGARFCHILDNAHNLPLHLAVELGVPVALLFCGLVAWLVWRGRPWAEQQPARQLAWGVLLAIGIHSLVEYPLWYGPFQIATVICIWLLWATRSAAAPAHEPAATGVAVPAWRWAVAALMLAAVGYTGWDYHRISQLYMAPDDRDAAYRQDPMRFAEQSKLFADSVRFAKVTSQPATKDNAAWMLPNAMLTLHFSPEPRVVTKVIESATYLGLDDIALVHLQRFRAAFPREHSEWMAGNVRQLEQARSQLAASASTSSGTATASKP